MAKQPIDIEHAFLDPSSEFQQPGDVLDCEQISQHDKIRILKQWEYDAKELATASDENMDGDDPDLLRRVLKALDKIKP